jgi:hypothetical protein
VLIAFVLVWMILTAAALRALELAPSRSTVAPRPHRAARQATAVPSH